MKWSSGEIYEGFFEDDVMHGDGIIIVDGEKRKIKFNRNIVKEID